MRNLLVIASLILTYAASAQNPGPKRDSTIALAANRGIAQFPDIESIAVFGPPAIFGGYSFYADRKGRLVHQSITEDAEKKYGYVEERLVLRLHAELFTRLVQHLQAVDFLTYREGRQHGIPDELRLRFELTLSNGSKIIATKWDHDKIAALDELLDRMRATIDAMGKIQKPIRIPYDSNDFGAHSRILSAS